MLLPCSGVSFDVRSYPISHVSAKLTIVTSKSELDVFSHHSVFSLKSRDFFSV